MGQGDKLKFKRKCGAVYQTEGYRGVNNVQVAAMEPYPLDRF